MKRVVLVMLAGALAASVSAAQDLERLFKAAVNTETVDRNCTAAIEQYQRVAAGGNRALAAQALLRMGGCYQQLGDVEAQQVYERVVRDFGEQADAVALARTRLAAFKAPARPPGDRIVKAGPDVAWGDDGRVSPDGRFISYVSYAGPKGLNLMLHDLVAGTDRALTDVDWNGGAAYSSAFSPDGKQVAYGWRIYGPPAHVNEIRVVALADPGVPRPRTVYKNDDVQFFDPTDWSPDGKALAARVSRKDGTKQIAIIGLDGSYRPLKTTEGWRGLRRIFFSPDGEYLAYDLPANDSGTQRDAYIISADASSDTRVIADASDDVVMGWSPDGTHLLFASDRNGPVGLWALPVDGGKPAGVPALLKPDIGSIATQGLTASGALYIVKDASTVNLQVAPIDLERGKLTGPPVLQIFRSGPPAWSPDGKHLVYSATAANGLPFLVIRSLDSGRVRELRPALSYMPHPQWHPDGRSIVVWGRDTKGRGVIVRIDVDTGQETFIAEASDIQRVQISPDGKKIYYQVDYFTGSSRPGRVIERDLTTGVERDVFVRTDGRGGIFVSPDGQKTAVQRAARDLSDSAPPARAGSDPDSTVTVFTVSGGQPRIVSLPATVDNSESVLWTADRRALLVVDTPDASPARTLYLVPVNGDPPRKLDIDIKNWGGIRLHPKGTQIAYFTGQDAREVWALENVLPGAGRQP